MCGNIFGEYCSWDANFSQGITPNTPDSWIVAIRSIGTVYITTIYKYINTIAKAIQVGEILQ